MRHVVGSRMVAHLWAHRLQDSARNSGGTFYFEGESIYSYGSHFRCGRIETGRNGRRAYILNPGTRSISTASHMKTVMAAIPCGATVFFTVTLDLSPTTGMSG
ncbi:hypothetical protein FACS1894159_07670 [Bacteroidia bacterium]|nr:hypothetical protein FACS1894159_07670 [Bacteroidia bacterium]